MSVDVLIVICYLFIMSYLCTAAYCYDKINKITKCNYDDFIAEDKLSTQILFGSFFSFLFIKRIRRIRKEKYEFSKWKRLDDIINLSKNNYNILDEENKKFYRNYIRKTKLKKLK